VCSSDLVGALALTCTLVVYGNVVEPAVNLAFVQHVLSMDTILPDSGIADRSITDPVLQRGAFTLIVVAEALTALLLWIGVALMLARLQAPRGALDGLNLVGLKRRGVARADITALRAAFQMLAQGEGAFQDRARRLGEETDSDYVREIVDFVLGDSGRSFLTPGK